MEVIASKDGTRIAVWRSGKGPALLLVHGASYDHANAWQGVRGAFEGRFTVYTMDRRGRGGSGDGAAYSLAREAEDVAAVVGAIGGPVNVVGHSYGGLCALEAARLAKNLRRLVLYESVPVRGADNYAPGAIARLEAKLAAGDIEGMLVQMMREVVGRSDEEIARLRADREAWAVRLANAPTLPRELKAEEGYVFDAKRFAKLTVPTLLLVGGGSSPAEHRNANAVAAALPDARVATLPGQGHTAMLLAPDLFVKEVTAFLAE